MITFGWPQLILTGIIVLGMGVSLSRHGQPKKNHDVVDWLIGPAITFALLWWGGFYG